MEQHTSAIDQLARKVTLKTAGYVAGFQGGVWALWILWDYAPWSRFADQLQLPNIGLQPIQVVIGTAVSFLMIWVGGSIAWRRIRRQLPGMRSQDKRTSAVDQVVRKLTLYTAVYVQVSKEVCGRSGFFGIMRPGPDLRTNFNCPI